MWSQGSDHDQLQKRAASLEQRMPPTQTPELTEYLELGVLSVRRLNNLVNQRKKDTDK